MSRGTVTVVIVALCLLVAIGVFIPLLVQTRVTSDNVRCQDHLRRIGFASLHATLPGEALPKNASTTFPAGTIKNAMLEPEDRLSFHVMLLQAIEQGPPGSERPQKKQKAPRPTPFTDLLRTVEVNKKWNAPVNLTVARTHVHFLLCPAAPAEAPEGEPALTQYVGMGGVGTGTPALPIAEAGKQAGAFGYDAGTPLAAIQDGLSQTIAFGETNSNLGPWLRGGPATVRGLDPDALPYLGIGRPFAGMHPGGGYFGFADNSVRFISERIDPAVFRAQLTIAGDEKFDVDAP